MDRRSQQRTARELATLARRVVPWAVAVCGPALAAVWLVEGDEDPWIRWGYPALALVLAAFGWVLLRRPRWTVPAAVATLVASDAWWVALGLAHVLRAPDVDTAWRTLVPAPLLSLALGLAIAFLFLRTRAALVHGAAASGALVLALAAAFLSRPGGAAYLWPLTRYAAFLGLDLIVLVALARAKERLSAAVARAARADAHASRMRDMAYLDELTGIANRRRLVEELDHQAGLAGPDHPVSVVFFDLDHFKRVNDELGHATGDTALQVVAEAAAGEVRDGDVLARLGGEEFVVVAVGADRERAVQLAERLRRRLPAAIEDAVGVRLTASFGVCALQPGEAPLAVLSRADALMYEAKTAGRDRVHAAELDPA